mmetsp:Transcript_82201/g.175978  ORF Transcript_82201/g.175978 Transcript_82201/m.175978 type:complete len:275 (-) Transcript_82201:302-1126(-)
MGVGKADDEGLWKACGEEEGVGAPTTAEVQNGHSILHSCALRYLRQGAFLGLGQELRGAACQMPCGALGVDAARILLPRAQPEVVELRRHFVMLLIGLCRADGDGHTAQLLYEGQLGGLVQLHAAHGLLADFLRQLQADAKARGPVREEAHVQQALRDAHRPMHQGLLHPAEHTHRQEPTPPRVQCVAIERARHAPSRRFPCVCGKSFSQADLPIVYVPSLEAGLAIGKIIMPTPQEVIVEALPEGAHLRSHCFRMLGEAAPPLAQRLRIGQTH